MDRQSQDTWRQLWDHYLPPYLSRDPQAVAALQLSAPSESPGLIRIRDRILEIPETNVFDLTQYTLSQLAAALTDAGWTASLVPSLPSDLAAAALMDTGYSAFSPTAWQDTAEFPWLTISGSVLWQYLRPVATALNTQWDNLVNFTLGTVEGAWLEDLGTYLGVPRIGGEPDYLYGQRIYGLALRTSSNNVAMEEFFGALGYSAVMQDIGPAQFSAHINWPVNPPAGFAYSQNDLVTMIDLLKAVGTLVTIYFLSALPDQLTVTDQPPTVIGTTPVPAYWGGSLGLSLGVVGIAGNPLNEFITVNPVLPY